MSTKNDGFHKIADFLSDYWAEMLNIVPVVLFSIWGVLYPTLKQFWIYFYPIISVVIMVICAVAIFRKNKSITACEIKIEEQGRRIQEQEMALEKFGQENAALFNYVLYILSKNIGLEDTDRISVYKKVRESFQTIGRYSLNPDYKDVHRNTIPTSEGFIGKALINGECLISFPETYKKRKHKQYVDWVIDNCNTTEAIINACKMKSCFYYCKALTNSTGMERTSVIVIESTKPNRFTKEEIEAKIFPEEAKIQAFVEKCRFAPIKDIQKAKEEGF